MTVGGGTGTSTWTAGALYVANSGFGTRTGILNINTGGLVRATALNGGNAASSVKFNGGTLQITATDSASNTINLLSGGGTIEVPNAGTTFTITSAISGSGILTKTGSGTLTLTSANTYSGGTTINDGTLLVNGSLISSANAVTVAGGAMLGGMGSIAGWVTNNGAIVPGASAGTLNLNGNYTQSGGGELQIELASASSFDQLKVGGTAALAGTLEVSLLGGYLPSDGTEFDILDWGSRSGTFTTVKLPVLPAGLEWDSSELYTTGTLAVSGLAGDFNVDGKVDAADYVVWRKNGSTQEEFNMWRANFGRTLSGSGSAADATEDLASVPEPASILFAVLAVMTFNVAASRRAY